MTTDPTNRVTLLASPEGEALTLAEVKQFLRIAHDAEDAAITTAITAARQAAQEHLRVLLLSQSYRYEFGYITHILPLPVGPAQSISTITAQDAQGNPTALATDSYRLTMDGHGVVFPRIPVGRRFTIEFTAGLLQVPAPVKQGMLHHIAAMLEQRGGEGGLPMQSRQLYQPYRRVRL